MTRRQLRQAVNGAYGAYLRTLTDLGKAIDPDFKLHGVAAAEEFVGVAVAAEAYAVFDAEQGRLNAEYSGHVNRPYIARQLRKAQAAAKANAGALVSAAEFRYRQFHEHLEKMRAGEFGDIRPDDEELAMEAQLLAAWEAAKTA